MTQAWQLDWQFGHAELQALGGMLGPLHFQLADGRQLGVLHVAPWSDMAQTAELPGIMQRLRGEWPCVPFGRVDCPSNLPAGWLPQQPDDIWLHGYAANHSWQCLEAGPHRVRLAIDYPSDSPVARIERSIEIDPLSSALDIVLTVWAKRKTRLPVGLHPTFRLPAATGRAKLVLGQHTGVFSYPVGAEMGVSRLLPETRSESLSCMAGVEGPMDLSQLPLAYATEELIQVRAVNGNRTSAPFALHYLDEEIYVGLWWDTEILPDLMLWLSNGGRADFPWLGRHFALGAEPVNSLFDLGRVARAPRDHPLADRLGVILYPDRPWHTRYRISAWAA